MIRRSRAISPAVKAAFHNISGAGKRHVKRKFFGLSDADQAAIVERVRRGVEDALRKG